MAIKCPECRQPKVREIPYPTSRFYVCHNCWYGWWVKDYVPETKAVIDTRFSWDGVKK